MLLVLVLGDRPSLTAEGFDFDESMVRCIKGVKQMNKKYTKKRFGAKMSKVAN